MHMEEAIAPNRFRELREERGCPQEAVALAVGRSASTVARYERNEIPVPDSVKAAAARFFGVTRAYLMGWDDEAEAA